MPSMTYLERLKEVCVWHDWNQPDGADLKARLDFHQKVIDEYFDLFAMIDNELGQLKAKLPAPSRIIRPYGIPQ